MIQIKDLLPHPLKEILDTEDSGIWRSDLRFEKGKNYLIKAPSGKGKSTFLHILYGLRNDFDGKVQLYQKTLSEIQPDHWAALRQEKLSIVFQDLRLFPSLTVRENLILKANLTASPFPLETACEKLGIGGFLDKPLHTLSFGQRQRVAIIRALCQPFDFLLLDEPFSHLDKENVQRAVSLIMDRAREFNASILLVSLGEDYDIPFDLRLTL